MTIENWDAFRRSIWNWKPLCRCFPRGIEPMDIDGWCEVGGVFLVLEGKAPGVCLKDGTVNTFKRMQRWNETVPGLFTIIVIWGDAENSRIDRIQFWPGPPFDGGWPQLIEYVARWAELAEERAAIQEESKPKLTIVKPAPVPRPILQELHADGIKWD